VAGRGKINIGGGARSITWLTLKKKKYSGKNLHKFEGGCPPEKGEKKLGEDPDRLPHPGLGADGGMVSL